MGKIINMLQDRAWVQNLADRNLKLFDKKCKILSFAEWDPWNQWRVLNMSQQWIHSTVMAACMPAYGRRMLPPNWCKFLSSSCCWSSCYNVVFEFGLFDSRRMVRNYPEEAIKIGVRNRFPRAVVKPFSLKFFKASLDKAMTNLSRNSAGISPAFSGWLD